MPFVLIHVATMGADCWERVAPLLDGDILAVDLPGRGSRNDIYVRSVTLDDCARAVVADVHRHDLTDVIMVAHSFGGVTVPKVMALIPERIRRAVLLSAVIPEYRTRALDQIDPKVRTTMESGIADGVYSVDTDAARTMLCNDTDGEQSTEGRRRCTKPPSYLRRLGNDRGSTSAAGCRTTALDAPGGEHAGTGSPRLDRISFRQRKAS